VTFASITQVPAQAMEHYRDIAAEAHGGTPPDGLLVRIAGESEDGGLRIVTVWESVVHHDRFVAERLHPALRRTGGDTDPGTRHVEFEVDELVVTR